MLRARAWFGGVGEEDESVVGSDVQAVETQAELANDGVAEVLDSGSVKPNVVGCPVRAKRVASGRELTHEV